MNSQSDNTSKDQPVDELEKILDAIGFKLKPVEIRGVKFADEIVITGKRKAKKALKALFQSECNRARLDPFDFVEPCEPECTPERHAHHQGQWDMATKMAAELQQIMKGAGDE